MKIGGYSPVYTKKPTVDKPKEDEQNPTKEDLTALKKEISGIFGKDSYKQSGKYLKISDDAYEKMLLDPEFKEEMLTMLKTEKKYTGSALITTTITADGWSSHNYASVSKENMKLVENLLPEYMNVDLYEDIEEDDDFSSTEDKETSIKDKADDYLEKTMYENSIQQIFKNNLSGKKDL